MRTSSARAIAMTVACGVLATAPARLRADSPPDRARLMETSWQLVRFQGGDGTTAVPDVPSKYTVTFGADGIARVRLDCNRGQSRWSSPGPGQLRFDALASTRAACGPGSLYDLVAKQWGYVRSYTIRRGHLFLALMADGGVYELEPASAPTEASPRSWLDREHPVSWNQPGAALPEAPPPSGDSPTAERCRSMARTPSLAADRALLAKGWTLFGPGQVLGETEVVLAASGVDGMCRPLGYQGFVFVGGALAGTISPSLMDSRTDGAAGLTQLRAADRLEVEFARYAPKDPLCCPSRKTSVSYRVERTGTGPVLVATDARTAPAEAGTPPR